MLSRASDHGGFTCSGFDGEHVTARSLVRRGLVTLTSEPRGSSMWRVERVRVPAVDLAIALDTVESFEKQGKVES